MDIINVNALKEMTEREEQNMLMLFLDDDKAEDYEEKYKEWQENETS